MAEEALHWKHGIFGLIALRQSSGRLLDGFVERWALPAKCAGRKIVGDAFRQGDRQLVKREIALTSKHERLHIDCRANTHVVHPEGLG